MVLDYFRPSGRCVKFYTGDVKDHLFCALHKVKADMAGISPSPFRIFQPFVVEQEVRVLIAGWLYRRCKAGRKRRFYIRPRLERRCQSDFYYSLMPELEAESGVDFIKYMRMKASMFRELPMRISE